MYIEKKEKRIISKYLFLGKTNVAASAFLVSKTKAVWALINQYFGDGSFFAEENYLKTTLMNVGAIFHPTPLLLNFARFDVLLEGKNGTLTVYLLGDDFVTYLPIYDDFVITRPTYYGFVIYCTQKM